MKRIAITVLVLLALTSCAEKENTESNYNTTENIETMEKQDKQQIESLLGDVNLQHNVYH